MWKFHFSTFAMAFFMYIYYIKQKIQVRYSIIMKKNKKLLIIIMCMYSIISLYNKISLTNNTDKTTQLLSEEDNFNSSLK